MPLFYIQDDAKTLKMLRRLFLPFVSCCPWTQGGHGVLYVFRDALVINSRD